MNFVDYVSGWILSLDFDEFGEFLTALFSSMSEEEFETERPLDEHAMHAMFLLLDLATQEKK